MMVMGYLNVDPGLPHGHRRSSQRSRRGRPVRAGLGLADHALKVPPFIATLAMMSVARGLANMITDGSQIIGFPDWFNMMLDHPLSSASCR